MSKFFGEFPEGFWEPVRLNDPTNMGESLVGKPEAAAKHIDTFRKKSREFGAPLPGAICELLKKSELQDVRGNGKCGVYAIMAMLYRRLPVLRSTSHALFMEQIAPIMHEHDVEENPRDIDSDVLCRIMRTYFSIYLPEIENPSFAVFSLTDGTVKFDATPASADSTDNLFTILHNSGHYKALLLTERDRRAVYLKLQEYMASNG